MILIDTHIWIWWVQGDPRLSDRHAAILREHEAGAGIALSAISCWEVAMLSRKNRIVLPLPVEQWVDLATAYPSMRTLDVTREIATRSALLPEPFHADPADRIIVATALIRGLPVLTVDARIADYPYVLKMT